MTRGEQERKRRQVIPDLASICGAGAAGLALWILFRPYAPPWSHYGWFVLGGFLVATVLGALCAARRSFIGFAIVVGPMMIASSTGSEFNDGTGFFALHYVYLLILGGVFTVGASLEL